MKTKASNIIVKDYLWSGHYIFGTFYVEEKDKQGNVVNKFILDDGDIYTIQDLNDNGYEVLMLTSEEIINAFKERFNK
jgi:hypothetical protein